MSRSLAERVAAAVRDRGLWCPGERVVVATSGGGDSVALADLLARTVDRHRGELELATVDHGTRDGSAADAQAVVALGRRLGLPVHVLTLSLGPAASEAACREARFAALRAVGGDVIALAHHRRDQAETLLIRLLRGTGPGGLVGMAWRAGDLARPLLDVDPDELARHVAAVGLPFVADPTNDDPRFLRNRVRRELLPLLEQLRPGAVDAVARTATFAREDADWVAEVARSLAPLDADGGFDAAALAALPVAAARRALILAWPALQLRHLESVLRACRSGAGTVSIGAGVEVVVNDGRVRICPPRR